MDHAIRNIFSPPHPQLDCHLSIKEPTREVLYSQPSEHIIRQLKNYYIPQKPLKSQQYLSCSTHYAEQANSIPFTRNVRERHFNKRPDSCLTNLDGKMLPSRPGIWTKQLNMKIWILMLSWSFLAMVLVNVFLWRMSF